LNAAAQDCATLVSGVVSTPTATKVAPIARYRRASFGALLSVPAALPACFAVSMPAPMARCTSGWEHAIHAGERAVDGFA
jgi:hypothetical protein